MARTTAAPAPSAPWNQVINVQWAGGLAVEFFDNAGPPVDASNENATRAANAMPGM